LITSALSQVIAPGLFEANLAQPNLTFQEATELAKEHPTPFLVLSPTKIRENIERLRYHLPGVRIYYAMKSNPSKHIMRIVRDLVDGIDVASFGEVRVCEKMGISSDRLVHSHPIKKQSDLKICYERGVRWFVFDNKCEIPKLRESAPAANFLLRVAIRNDHCIVNLSSKFGAQKEDVVPLLREARKSGLNVRGIAFHVGSQCTDPLTYLSALEYVRGIFDAACSLGLSLDTLDIGGGFPVSYRESLPNLGEFCEVVSDAIGSFFPSGVAILAEPGRCISGDSITLVTRVIGSSKRDGVTWYYIDDGVYGAFSGKFFDNCDYRLVPSRNGRPTRCVVAGPTCDSIDIVARDQQLPPLAIGDLILVPGMGAYTSASATSFNGFPPPAVVVFPRESCRTQRHRRVAVKEVTPEAHAPLAMKEA
jgi:ornithine decarboxylase